MAIRKRKQSNLVRRKRLSRRQQRQKHQQQHHSQSHSSSIHQSISSNHLTPTNASSSIDTTHATRTRRIPPSMEKLAPNTHLIMEGDAIEVVDGADIIVVHLNKHHQPMYNSSTGGARGVQPMGASVGDLELDSESLQPIHDGQDGADQDDEEEDEINGDQEQDNDQEEDEDEEIGMFGVEIEQLMELQGEENGDVPMILPILIEQIVDNGGLDTEGLFRISGNALDIETIARDGFDPEDSEQMAKYSVHTWASLLKKWIRELPTPLLPSYLYDPLFACDQPEAIAPILARIESSHVAHVLDTVGLFFGRVLQPDTVSKTRMDVEGLARVLMPTIFTMAPDIQTSDVKAIIAKQQRQMKTIKLLLMYYIKAYQQQQENQEEEQEETPSQTLVHSQQPEEQSINC